MYKIVIKRNTDRTFNWTLNRNGKVLATANQGYVRKGGAVRTASHLGKELGLTFLVDMTGDKRQEIRIAA